MLVGFDLGFRWNELYALQKLFDTIVHNIIATTGHQISDTFVMLTYLLLTKHMIGLRFQDGDHG